MKLLICLSFCFFFLVQYGQGFLYFTGLLKESAFVVTDFVFVCYFIGFHSNTYYFPFCTHFGFHLLLFFLFLKMNG